VARVSLLDGWFPHLVVLLAVATLAVGLVSARRRWRGLGWMALAVAAGMVVLGIVIGRLDLIGDSFPKSFYAWVGLVFFAGGVVAVGWRPSRWWCRAVALSSVVVTLAMAATLINQHYAYFPTPAALFGQVAVDQMPMSHLAALTRPAAATAVRAVDPWNGKPPTADETAIELAAAAPPAAARTHGAVVTVDLPARTSHFTHRNAVVYLPPAWFNRPRPKLPVIMMLTGTPSLVSDWTRAAHADQIADDYAAAHHGFAPVLVFPDPNGSNLGDTECVDSPQGNAETYLTEDVPREVVALFGSAPAPWAVAGLSEGGMCAALLTLRRPDVFTAFGDFSGEPGPIIGHDRAATMRLLYGGSRAAWHDHDPLTLLGRRRFDGHAAWFEVGRDDRGPLDAAHRLDVAAREAGMTTHLVVRSGKHNFTFWSEAFRHALPWLTAHLEGDGSLASAP
jgi:S-formylglutathione hydrolase FrmB